MKQLKYTIIKTRKQYNDYCRILEDLISQDKKVLSDEIELLTLLIEKWDEAHNTFDDRDPVQLIRSLMEENSLKPKDLLEILGLSKGTVSKILNYQKGLSKETIRALSKHFKVNQSAFNRPYPLVNEVNKHFRNARLMNTKKDLDGAKA
ncbi:MAG: helix-turn-helix domain-containing protein [Flavobacteriales bacterium]|nr:helix-turn-helix domain-containing protein [Flavobacteriales bacterium]